MYDLQFRARSHSALLRHGGSLAGVRAARRICGSGRTHPGSMRDRRPDLLCPGAHRNSHSRLRVVPRVFGLVVSERDELLPHVRPMGIAGSFFRSTLFRLALQFPDGLSQHAPFAVVGPVAPTRMGSLILSGRCRSSLGGRSAKRDHDCPLAGNSPSTSAWSLLDGTSTASAGDHLPSSRQDHV